MKKFLVLILCCCMLTACGDSKTDKNSVSESTSEIPSVPEGEIGEIITPDENDDEYDLGEYRYSPSGTKLYFNDDEYPKELVLTLEKYFTSFAEKDFEKYKSCLSLEYIDIMSEYLEKNYSYGLDTSFEKQCTGLSEKMGGDFHITRIRAEKTAENPEQDIEDYFSEMDEFFSTDFGAEVKKNTDNFYHMTFYVMAEDSQKAESLLVSGYDIFFAEKDGSYYTFG